MIMKIRTSTGMLKKVRKGDIITVIPYMKMKGERLIGLKKSKICIKSNRTATRVKDGIPLKRMKGKWIYFAK